MCQVRRDEKGNVIRTIKFCVENEENVIHSVNVPVEEIVEK
jgi:hypothetical protein